MFAILISLFFSTAQAETFSLGVSAITFSQRLMRGAPTWSRAVFFPGVSLKFWDLIQIRGPQIMLSPSKRDDSWQYSLTLAQVDDNEPFLNFSDKGEGLRNQRPDSTEITLAGSYHFGFRKKFVVGMEFVQEISEHKGQFFTPYISAPILPFTSLTYKMGIADQSFHHYLYDSRTSGVAYHSIASQVVFPFLPWPGIAMLNFERQVILQGNARHASFIRGDYANNILSFLITWKALSI